MTIGNTEALTRVIEHREIFHDEMLHLMRQIMSGEVSPVMIAAITAGLRVKKETIGEITAAAQIMREFSTKVEVADKTHLVDIVGTGGDGSHTFNISTCSMFVVAAAGNNFHKPLPEPANCKGVISVGALDAENRIEVYSALDSRTTLYAPGGGKRLSASADWSVNKLKVASIPFATHAEAANWSEFLNIKTPKHFVINVPAPLKE